MMILFSYIDGKKVTPQEVAFMLSSRRQAEKVFFDFHRIQNLLPHVVVVRYVLTYLLTVELAAEASQILNVKNTRKKLP